MITLDGSTRRTFTFPDHLDAATRFYRDFDTVLQLLPHISLVQKYGPNQYRALYHTTELGAYRVKIYCDLHVQFQAATQTLHVAPLRGLPPVKQSVGVQALVAQGYFTSKSVFRTHGAETRVDYELQLGASLPKPFALSLVPDSVMNQIASSIADWRIHEIAEGFITRSIAAYHRQPIMTAAPEYCPAALQPLAAREPASLQID